MKHVKELLILNVIEMSKQGDLSKHEALILLGKLEAFIKLTNEELEIIEEFKNKDNLNG